jgi:hypothetical protein
VTDQGVAAQQAVAADGRPRRPPLNGSWSGKRDTYGDPVTTPRHSFGFVYILTNDMMPDLVKIGLTTALPEDRAKELFNTGVPNSFNVAFRAREGDGSSFLPFEHEGS